ncbi:hypothetical protein ACLB1T_30615 [Escherichia coli]
MQNLNEDLHTAGFIMTPTRSQQKLRHYLPAIMVCSPMRMQQTPSGNVADEGSNPINDHTVTFAVLSRWAKLL